MLRVELEIDRGELGLALGAEVEAAHCLALVGPSGSGKTSTLEAVAGLLRPSRGAIECDASTWLDTERRVDLPPERRRCGYVFQHHALFGHLCAWRNVAFALRHVPRRERRARALELLERFGIAELAQAQPAALSGGERQRLALARALASRPRVLLLDEPLSALDAVNRARAARELREVSAAAAVPTLLVTHDFDQAVALADRISVLERGTIVQSGTPAELVARPASGFVAELVGSVVLTGTARPAADGLTAVALDGGGEALSTDRDRRGAVSVSVHPWAITLEPPGAASRSSVRNRLSGRVRSVSAIGNRVRVAVDAGQPLVAEVTAEAAAQLALEPGREVVAIWKASATRLSER